MSILKELKFFAKELTILVVEDQKDLNEELVELTKLFFKKVDFAYDGVEALELYKKHNHDVILSDITMPNMNGTKLSREVKHINAEQPIVILSAHSELEYLIELIDIGVNQFIAKPFKEDELFYRLLKVSENIVHKEHYLNSLMPSSKYKDVESFEEEVELEDFEDFGINKEELTHDVEDIIKKYESQEPTLDIEKIDEEKIVKSIEKDSKKLVEHEVVSADNFFENLQSDKLISDVLDEQVELLMEQSDYFESCIEKIYLNKLDASTIKEISAILNSIYGVFSFLETLRPLGEVLNDLSKFLEELDFDNLEKEKQDKLKILEFVYDDISRFIETVFVYKDTLDVHYLEDSLRSSVEQIKMNVLSNNAEEEDELELF